MKPPLIAFGSFLIGCAFVFICLHEDKTMHVHQWGSWTNANPMKPDGAFTFSGEFGNFVQTRICTNCGWRTFKD
jgi:hypothetical protein